MFHNDYENSNLLFFNKRCFLSLLLAKEVFTFVVYSSTFLKHQNHA